MKKVLRALSIGAMALQGAALLVFLLTVALQRQLMSLMSYSPEMLPYFIFPGVQTVYLLLVTAVIVAIGVSTLAQGRSIWAEIVGIVMLAVVCTLFYRVGVQAEIRLFAAPRGATYLAAYSARQALTGIANSISGLASSLALVACGMSIAEKKLAPRA